MNPGNFFAELKRRNVYKVAASFVRCGETSPLFEIPLVLVRFDHVAGGIVNAMTENVSLYIADEKLTAFVEL